MEKSKTSKKKDIEKKKNTHFVKNPSMNYFQASGVEFRGEYLTLEQIATKIRIHELIKKGIVIDND